MSNQQQGSVWPRQEAARSLAAYVLQVCGVRSEVSEINLLRLLMQYGNELLNEADRSWRNPQLVCGDPSFLSGDYCELPRGHALPHRCGSFEWSGTSKPVQAGLCAVAGCGKLQVKGGRCGEHAEASDSVPLFDMVDWRESMRAAIADWWQAGKSASEVSRGTEKQMDRIARAYWEERKAREIAERSLEYQRKLNDMFTAPGMNVQPAFDVEKWRERVAAKWEDCRALPMIENRDAFKSLIEEAVQAIIVERGARALLGGHLAECADAASEIKGPTYLGWRFADIIRDLARKLADAERDKHRWTAARLREVDKARREETLNSAAPSVRVMLQRMIANEDEAAQP